MATSTADRYRRIRGSDAGPSTQPLIRDFVAAARRRQRRRRLRNGTARLAIVAAGLCIWQILATVWLDPFYYAKPSMIWQRLVDWATSGTPLGPLWTQIGTTLAEAGIGFLPGAACAVVVGVTVGRNATLGDVVGPLVRIANQAPRVALASLFVVWFGLGISPKIVTVVVMVFFAVVADTFDSVRSVGQDKIDQAYLFGARWAWVLRHVVLASAGPRIVRSLHAAFGLALTGAIVGEFIGASRGLGALIHDAQANFDAAGVCAGTFLATALAVLAHWMLARLSHLMPTVAEKSTR